MKKFKFKSRKGFTLIELLVVIGILAVLAAIAIPSVAGLIDRANVSADDTNANEMTNALERFASEYELFCQDIASGKLNTNDLDAAQSRVYNVTGADSREDITLLEGSGLAGKKINRDTKYPENVATTKSIVENYTKTSSATYEPKQSDMNFYYSPDCGVIVFAEASTSTDVTDTELIKKLNGKIISGKDAKGKILDETTEWLNLSIDTTDNDFSGNVDLNHGNVSGDLIPEGATYFDASKNTTLIAGKPFPETVENGDKYEFGDYVYTYGNQKIHSGLYVDYQEYVDGWIVKVKDNTQTEYSGSILANINQKPLVSMEYLYYSTNNITKIADDFYIPSTVLNIEAIFANENIKKLPNNFYIPNGVKNLSSIISSSSIEYLPDNFKIPSSAIDIQYMFGQARELKRLPDGFTIPDTVTDPDVCVMFFEQCNSLEYIPEGFSIPLTATDCFYMFDGCRVLERLPSSFVVHKNITKMQCMFEDCHKLSGTIRIDADPTVTETYFKSMFYANLPSGVTKLPTITLTGDCSNLNVFTDSKYYNMYKRDFIIQ